MQKCVFFLFLCTNFYVFGQNQYAGVVKDFDTNEALPYVNIGILNKGIGTVTNENGRFLFDFDFSKISKTDTIQISSVGYETIQKVIGDLNFKSANNKILLVPDVFGLDEVVLSPDSQQIRQQKVGFYMGDSRKYGYWRGGTSLGAEMVTNIKASKRPRQLNEFTFEILKNLSDGLRLRVNVYRGDTQYPEIKINKKNIFFTLTQKYGVVTIDLTPYEIYVDDDFRVGLELVNVFGEKIDLTLSGSDDPGTSYRRYASQDEWHRYRNDALAFAVNTTVFDKDDLITRNKESLVKEQQQVTKKDKVSGMVFNKGNPLVNVDVRVEGKEESASTDENGRYSINATLGDVITFNFLDMETVSRKVLETTFGINVSMQVKVTELDGVTVTKREKVKKTQEELFENYNKNPELIKTSFGILDKNVSAVSLNILDEGEFKATSINILEAVSGKFPGVRLATINNPNAPASAYDTNAVLFGRVGGSILNIKPMVYEIDGVLQVDVPRQLNMDNVKRIAILPGLAASSRYGNIAVGGVVIINTKVNNFSPGEEDEVVDQLRVKDNNYKDDAISQKQAKRNWPNYLKKMYAADSYVKAKEVFQGFSKNFSSSPYFLIDSYVYFKKYWKSTIDVDTMISDNAAIFDKDLPSLTALAYTYEKTGEFKKAELVYLKLFKLRPNNAQSYLDLARNYTALGDDNKALGLYTRYNHLLNKEFLQVNTKGLHDIIVTEFGNLTRRTDDSDTKNLTDLSNIETDILTGTRVVLDWNESKADFEVQIVNPRNRYFSWKNSPDMDGENDDETIFSKEFFIDDYMQGDWLLNINYKGAETTDPMYLKATIFFNYGLPNQRSTVQLFRLHLKNVNQQLFTLSGNPISFAK